MELEKNMRKYFLNIIINSYFRICYKMKDVLNHNDRFYGIEVVLQFHYFL